MTISVDPQFLFPTPILCFRNDNINVEEMNKGIESYVMDQCNKEKGNQYSIIGDGWHSSSDLTELDYQWSRDLKSLILEVCGHYMNRDLSKEEILIDAWAVLLNKGGSSNYHCHAGWGLSGVYYTTVPEGIDKDNGSIHFPDFRSGAMASIHEMPTAVFPPNEGTGFVFQSWCPHYVTPHVQDKPRISVSWNMLSKGDKDSRLNN